MPETATNEKFYKIFFLPFSPSFLSLLSFDGADVERGMKVRQ